MVKYPVIRNSTRRWSLGLAPWVSIPFDGHLPPFCHAPQTGVQDQGFVTATDQVTLSASQQPWRYLIAAGKECTSALSGTKYLLSWSSGGFTCQGSGPNACFRTEMSGKANVGGFPVPNQANVSLADSKAREKALDHYLNAVKSWRGGNFLAEFRETVHMLRHPIQNLFGHTQHFVAGVHRIRGLAKRNPTKYAGQLGNLWLAFSFGWKPLFDDIRDANSAITKLGNGTGSDTLKISGRGEASTAYSYGNSNASAPVSVYAAFAKYTKAHSEVRYKSFFGARPESFATVADTFGISAGDLLPAVWEAIPWSFFIDYFLNVQGVIDSWQYANSGFKFGIRGERTRTSQILSAWYPANVPPNVNVSIGVGGSEAAVVQVGRGRLSSPPYVGFRFRVPGMGSLKWVNTSALISQIAASRPPR
jgi:hypothetical protein